MSESEWWATAPQWAKWHTWDMTGKTWWEKRPAFFPIMPAWSFPEPAGDTVPGWWYYDETPLPVEIDPAETLRKRPKVQA